MNKQTEQGQLEEIEVYRLHLKACSLLFKEKIDMKGKQQSQRGIFTYNRLNAGPEVDALRCGLAVGKGNHLRQQTTDNALAFDGVLVAITITRMSHIGDVAGDLGQHFLEVLLLCEIRLPLVRHLRNRSRSGALLHLIGQEVAAHTTLSPTSSNKTVQEHVQITIFQAISIRTSYKSCVSERLLVRERFHVYSFISKV